MKEKERHTGRGEGERQRHQQSREGARQQDRERLTNKHPVFVRVTRVLDDWNYIGSLLGDVYQITPTPVRKLHCVHKTILGKATTQSV